MGSIAKPFQTPRSNPTTLSRCPSGTSDEREVPQRAAPCGPLRGPISWLRSAPASETHEDTAPVFSARGTLSRVRSALGARQGYGKEGRRLAAEGEGRAFWSLSPFLPRLRPR